MLTALDRFCKLVHFKFIWTQYFVLFWGDCAFRFLEIHEILSKNLTKMYIKSYKPYKVLNFYNTNYHCSEIDPKLFRITARPDPARQHLSGRAVPWTTSLAPGMEINGGPRPPDFRRTTRFQKGGVRQATRFFGHFQIQRMHQRWKLTVDRSATNYRSSSCLMEN